jgi:hypothetical protein
MSKKLQILCIDTIISCNIEYTKLPLCIKQFIMEIKKCRYIWRNILWKKYNFQYQNGIFRRDKSIRFIDSIIKYTKYIITYNDIKEFFKCQFCEKSLITSINVDNLNRSCDACKSRMPRTVGPLFSIVDRSIIPWEDDNLMDIKDSGTIFISFLLFFYEKKNL